MQHTRIQGKGEDHFVVSIVVCLHCVPTVSALSREPDKFVMCAVMSSQSADAQSVAFTPARHVVQDAFIVRTTTSVAQERQDNTGIRGSVSTVRREWNTTL